MMRRFFLLTAMLAFSLVLFGCSQDNPTAPATDDGSTVALDKHGSRDRDRTARYAITITNLTPATGPGASQPFSPPILATHKRGMHIFKRGHYASDALAMVAEDAQAGALLDLLHDSPRVHEVAMGGDVVLPGGDMSFEIETEGHARRLSLVFMLVNTNDAFGGLDGVRLPRHGERTYRVRAWDAGSEVNTELMADIPGPCCGSPGMGTDEHRRIRRHRGILGVGELPVETYDWDGAVAKVTVRRID